MKPLGVCLAALLWAGSVGPARSQDAAKPGVVASVNGKSLSELDFFRRCERKVGGASDTAVGLVVLQEWIDEVIADEEAARRKVLPTEEDITRRLLAVRKMFEFRGESFDDWLAAHGRSVASLRDEIRRQLTIENLLTENVTLNAGELETFYASNKNTLGLPEQIRVSIITAPNKKTADLVESRLKKKALFETVARELSVDQFAKAGGQLPNPVVANPKVPGVLEPQIIERALKTPVGQTSDPLQVDGDFVFVRLDEKLPARAPALADVADLLLSDLRVKKGGPERLKAAQEKMRQLQIDAKIEIFRPEYRPLLKRYGTKA